MNTMTDELPATWGCDSFEEGGMDILPDLPEAVHGIKSLSPCIIQCDGCGKTDQGEKVALTVILSDIVFNHRSGDPRRLCAGCWKMNGWVDTTARGWVQVTR